MRELMQMAGQRRTRAERVTERQIQKFRREVAEAEHRMLLIYQIKQREAGAAGMRPMPLQRK